MNKKKTIEVFRENVCGPMCTYEYSMECGKCYKDISAESSEFPDLAENECVHKAWGNGWRYDEEQEYALCPECQKVT